jgi:hypothetical protein
VAQAFIKPIYSLIWGLDFLRAHRVGVESWGSTTMPCPKAILGGKITLKRKRYGKRTWIPFALSAWIKLYAQILAQSPTPFASSIIARTCTSLACKISEHAFSFPQFVMCIPLLVHFLRTMANYHDSLMPCGPDFNGPLILWNKTRWVSKEHSLFSKTHKVFSQLLGCTPILFRGIYITWAICTNKNNMFMWWSERCHHASFGWKKEIIQYNFVLP